MRFSSISSVAIAAMLLGAASAKADSPAPVCDVYLTPFTVLGSDNSLEWVGKAVQQNLETDLARAKLHPQASEKPIANTADAQSAAKSAGAKFLISGSYQVSDQQVRFTGQVIDTATGNVLGGISATGAMRDLFKLEDDLSNQAVAELTKQQAGVANGANQPVNKPAPAAPVQAPAAPAPPPVVVQIVQPGAGVGVAPAPSHYQGSALEQYVNSNRAPSSDYTSLPSQDNSAAENFASTPGSNYNVGFQNFWIMGYGVGYGYPLPPYGRYGYGTDGHPHHKPGDLQDH